MTPLGEARRLQHEWHETGFKDWDDIKKKASDTIDALVALVVASEHSAIAGQSWPPTREYQFDGAGEAPSFVIIAKGNNVDLVVNNQAWTFDQGLEMSKEMWDELRTPLESFLNIHLSERTIHAMAGTIRHKLQEFVQQGRIRKKIL